ncbi:MAG: hypothetical protein WA883_05590 [Phormidesmis sp.]
MAKANGLSRLLRTSLTRPNQTGPGSIRRSLLAAIATVPVTVALLVSCQSQSSDRTLSETGRITSDTAPAAQTPSTQISKIDKTVGTQSQKITFRHADGTPEFSLLFKSTGGKLLDSTGAVIANLILESDGTLRLTNASNAVTGYIVRTEDSILLEGPKRTKTLFSFTQDASGDASLIRSNGSTVYQLNATSTGYTVKSDKAALYTVRMNKGIGHLQTSDGVTVVATDSNIAPAALASFGFTKLTQAQQAGLAYALSTYAKP